MPSVKVVVSAALAFAMATSASTVCSPIQGPHARLSELCWQLQITARLNSDNSKCPSDWQDITNGDDEKCCYGSLLTIGPVPYCCVRDTSADFSTGFRARDEVESDCFPSCSDTTNSPASVALPDTPTESSSCATKVPFSASDYSKLVSSASASIASSGQATNTASQGSATSTGDSSATSPSSGSESSTGTSTNAAMPIMTAESMMFGGAAMAAALLAF